MGQGTSTPDSSDGTVPGVCRIFNSPKAECGNGNCQELHVCFHFVTGSCRYGDKCSRGHLLTTIHNKTVLKANGWHHDNQHPKILKLLEEKFKPKADKPEEKTAGGLRMLRVCFSYNTVGCGSDECKYLHLCLNSVMKKCVLGSKCRLEHDLIKSDHNLRVLRETKLLDIEQRIIYDNLTEKYVTISNQLKKDDANKREDGANQTQGSTQDTIVERPQKKHDAERDKPKSRKAPSACIDYNKHGCNNSSCPFLHVCFGYIMGKCDKHKTCLKGHDVFQGEQNKEVLRKFDLLGTQDVLARIREGYSARAAAKTAAIKSSDVASGGATPPPPSAAQSHVTPQASLTCSVCCEAFIRATTLGCTHTFCEDCVRRAERHGQPCPLCRVPIATAVRSLVIDDTVTDWFDGQDEQTQRARRQLEMERRRAAAVPAPLMATPAARTPSTPPAGGEQRREAEGHTTTIVVTTTVKHF